MLKRKIKKMDFYFSSKVEGTKNRSKKMFNSPDFTAKIKIQLKQAYRSLLEESFLPLRCH